jgi:sarcosine oxidase subunit gamma
MVERVSALAAGYKRGDHGTITAAGPGVTLQERRPLAIFQVIALGGSEAAVRSGLATALGTAPADAAGRAARKDGTAILWVGPGRWLVVEAERAGRDLGAILLRAVADPAVVTDISQGRSVIRVSGPAARDLLAKGFPVDLHPRAFPVDACAQSLLGHVGAFVHAVDAVPSFDLYVARSYALTAWEWLVESAAEYGCRVAYAGFD